MIRIIKTISIALRGVQVVHLIKGQKRTFGTDDEQSLKDKGIAKDWKDGDDEEEVIEEVIEEVTEEITEEVIEEFIEEVTEEVIEGEGGGDEIVENATDTIEGGENGGPGDAMATEDETEDDDTFSLEKAGTFTTKKDLDAYAEKFGYKLDARMKMALMLEDLEAQSAG